MDVDEARVVEFPLRGDNWMALNSPADRIPSHGTDIAGQRYAIDLLKVDGRSQPRFHRASTLRTLVFGVPTNECYAWGEPVHAPMNGEVLVVENGVDEPRRVHPIGVLFRVMWNGLTFRPASTPLNRVLGNHVIMRNGDVHAAFVHLAPGTVEVTPGQTVHTGDVVGRVGHTGNSTSPHLHFQLMDSMDPLDARGIRFEFQAYELLEEGRWQRVERAVPKNTQRIRSVDTTTAD